MSNLTPTALLDLTDAAKQPGEDVRGRDVAQNQFGSNRVKIFSLQELFDAPEEECSWVVEELLPVAGSSIVHGKPKKGKSTLVRQLAVAVSQGRPFLGRTTLQGPVLYLALEEKLSAIREHFEILGAKGADPINVIPDHRGHDLRTLQSVIMHLKPVLVIVDTLAKLINLKKYNEYGPVNESLRQLHDLARDTETHLLCVHHSKKGAEEDATDNLLGSVALAGAVDTLIALQGTKDRRTLSSSQRYGVSMEETTLKFNPETRSLLLGDTTAVESEETKRQTLCRISERIVEFVTSNPGCTEPEILEGVIGKRETIKTQLRELRDYRLRREGKGVAGNPFRYYADVPVEVENTC